MAQQTVKVIFIINDTEEKIIDAPIGLSLLEVAHQNKIDLEGACEGSLACSTCHVIVDSNWYQKLPLPVEEEEDMLDLAFGLTSTSRLGCQVIITKDLHGLRVRLPAATRNVSLL
ncbi:2Fe-2S iron-sulfur cluster binding domain protein [Orientia chuto str. Dubai]|uniref:2Fe-2S ferredoxin n=1 Tax=Orientia chuto str. Dubai TaxID=1359168 RepID=A0A0F3MNN9_9RICK|nr:ferredoxin family 2Fe-2S iron-sulfur cluster binding protein [Candidatus Orientia mediorientalis]KJV57276.1 2Fe-2S iron-sulfur cluster binding domain protein [Orientia chuto str. Dubai]